MEKDKNITLETQVSDGYRQNEDGDEILDSGLKAGLKNRMINLIALCGLIGPGGY
ncbi:hypothetical protein JL09_g5755 [Pichia kudriavzevii]|uniref:Uncharacterized protein n=1 Tax=Pichia kudriavzevii TaxID=4909 RepID=A0A099NRA2_PICKU|nr:hypothetical protein JL09_g5755 [Pichia kudriavzevii]